MLFKELTSLEQQALSGGGSETFYVRYNDGFLGGDGYFKQTGGLENSFKSAGEVIGTYDSGSGTTSDFTSNGGSKTKDNGPSVEGTDTFTGEASRLGGESTVMEIRILGNGDYKLVG